MNPESLIKRAAKLERKESLTGLLDAIKGMPLSQRAALAARVMKEVAAGTMSPAEANRITKAMKT